MYPALQPNRKMVCVENGPSVFCSLLPVDGSMGNPLAGDGSEHGPVKYD